jgi:hypothetical protein
MNKKEFFRAAFIGAAAVGAVRISDAIRKSKKPFPKDDEIPEWVLLNKGRKLMREGKTKEACEMVRASYEMAEGSSASGHGSGTYSAFGMGIIGAFRNGSDSPDDEATRKNTDDVIIAFMAETAPDIADWIRKTRDEYYAKH